MARLGVATDLTMVQAFMNTRAVEDGTDHLTDPQTLQAWLVAQGLAPETTTVEASDVAVARRLRQALRDLAADDPALTAAATDALNHLAGSLNLTVRFVPDGSVELGGAASGATGVLARLVATVAAAMADGSWRRVKLCSDDRCRYAFYDRSRNRSGRWCDMAVCGNRAKARTFRERHR